MAPVRFCHVTTFYPPYNFGGDGIGIQRLCRALVRRGHEVTVVHEKDAYDALRKGPSPEPVVEPGIERISLESGIGALSPMLVQQLGAPVVHRRRLETLLERGRFDVINFHNSSLVGGPGLFSMGRGTKIYMAHEHWLVCESHVLWRHGREPCDRRECLRCVLHHHRPPQLWRRTGWLESQARHIDAFIAMSEFSRNKHRELDFPFEMEVVPYFLPDANVLPDANSVDSDTKSPHDSPYFLFVGRLERLKGLQDVLPLFRNDLGADLLIAGDGEYGEELRRMAPKSARVRFLGRVGLDELPRYYRHAVALIVPSVGFETFGIILIEAFRNRTPVIARRRGPFPEIVEASGAGDLFETPEELRAALQAALASPERQRARGELGFRRFEELWSESAVLPRYLSVVRRAAERRGDRALVNRLS
ncbi:MAG: glycosyltransferase family 4 protein [Deltaproteobacteria bacterium]|nr:glycosyltransferase family 4 protein [Deltaproteobacteria bacterium]